MSEEEIKAIEILGFSPIFRGRKPENDCFEMVLNLIGKQQKVIDLMAEYLNENNREFWTDDIEETKQYFYKKAEEEK